MGSRETTALPMSFFVTARKKISNNTCPSVSVIKLFKVKLILWDTEKFH